MKTARFGVLAALLALGVGAAVSTLLAQPTPTPSPEPGPSPRSRDVRILHGHGGHLGVTVQDLSAEDLTSAGGAASGVRIESVDSAGAAAKAGVQQGDIVVELDGERVRSAAQFSRLVRETPVGRTVKMTVVRGGQTQTLDVTPDRRRLSMIEIDEDGIRREVERGLRGLDRLPRFRYEVRPPILDWDDRWTPFRRPRARLGVQLDTLTPQLAEYFGAKDGGVLVSSVTPGSPAEEAGLKAGDVIVSINAARVRSVNDLRGELRDSPAELSIGIVRDKQETTITGKVPER